MEETTGKTISGESEEIRSGQTNKGREDNRERKISRDSDSFKMNTGLIADRLATDLIDFCKRQRVLANIDRCNQLPKIKPYSVAEHNYYSVLFGMLLCDLVNIDRERSQHINVEEVMRRLVLHDHEESVTGDILFPLHNEFPEFAEQLDRVRKSVVESEVFRELPNILCEYYSRIWGRAKDESEEGQMVAIIDKFEIMMFAIQEIELGNNQFRQIFRNAVQIILKDCPFTVVRRLVDRIAIIY